MDVQARISYYLSPRGRKDSLLKGGDGKRQQLLTGVVSNRDDLNLFDVDVDGQVTFDATAMFVRKDERWHSGEPDFMSGRAEIEWHVVPTWDDLMDVMRQESSDLAPDESGKPVVDREAEKRAASVGERFLSDPTARAGFISEDYVTIEGCDFWMDDPVAIEARDRWSYDREELRRSNRAILTAWVKEHGTDNQRQRLAAGLLAWEEAYEGMTEHVYAPLAGFPLYERFNVEEICHHVLAGGEACKVKFRSVDAMRLTADEWETYSKIQAVMPTATFQLREHTAACTLADAPERRRGVIVKVAVDCLTFKGEYAL